MKFLLLFFLLVFGNVVRLSARETTDAEKIQLIMKVAKPSSEDKIYYRWQSEKSGTNLVNAKEYTEQLFNYFMGMKVDDAHFAAGTGVYFSEDLTNSAQFIRGGGKGSLIEVHIRKGMPTLDLRSAETIEALGKLGFTEDDVFRLKVPAAIRYTSNGWWVVKRREGVEFHNVNPERISLGRFEAAKSELQYNSEALEVIKKHSIPVLLGELKRNPNNHDILKHLEIPIESSTEQLIPLLRKYPELRIPILKMYEEGKINTSLRHARDLQKVGIPVDIGKKFSDAKTVERVDFLLKNYSNKIIPGRLINILLEGDPSSNLIGSGGKADFADLIPLTRKNSHLKKIVIDKISEGDLKGFEIHLHSLDSVKKDGFPVDELKTFADATLADKVTFLKKKFPEKSIPESFIRALVAGNGKRSTMLNSFHLNYDREFAENLSQILNQALIDHRTDQKLIENLTEPFERVPSSLKPDPRVLIGIEKLDYGNQRAFFEYVLSTFNSGVLDDSTQELRSKVANSLIGADYESRYNRYYHDFLQTVDLSPISKTRLETKYLDDLLTPGFRGPSDGVNLGRMVKIFDELSPRGEEELKRFCTRNPNLCRQFEDTALIGRLKNQVINQSTLVEDYVEAWEKCMAYPACWTIDAFAKTPPPVESLTSEQVDRMVSVFMRNKFRDLNSIPKESLKDYLDEDLSDVLLVAMKNHWQRHRDVVDKIVSGLKARSKPEFDLDIDTGRKQRRDQAVDMISKQIEGSQLIQKGMKSDIEMPSKGDIKFESVPERGGPVGSVSHLEPAQQAKTLSVSGCSAIYSRLAHGPKVRNSP